MKGANAIVGNPSNLLAGRPVSKKEENPAAADKWMNF
jgi:hypothetical protein